MVKMNRGGRGTVTAKCGTKFFYTIGDDASYRLAKAQARDADNVTRLGFWRANEKKSWRK